MKTRKGFCLGLVALLALVVFVGCSDDDDPVTPPPDPTVTETIGAAGGTLTMEDKLGLEIPAGALAADVDFVAGPSDVPPTLPAGLVAVSDFFDIEPSGTDFGQDATLTLFYDEDAIPDFIPEDELVIFTHDGADWDDLKGSVNEDANSVTADIGHLSVFVVTAPEPEDPDPAYMEFEIGRRNYGDPDGVGFEGYDYLEADFRSTAPLKIPDYLDAGDVSYGAWALQSGMGGYYYSNDDTPMFLTLGNTYDLVVEGSLEVAPLTLPVAVMDEAALINNITDNQELDLDGFTVVWSGTALGGMVDISLDTGGSVSRTVENTGSYTFDQADLGDLSAGPGTITLEWHTSVPVTAEGYLEQSKIELQTSHEVPVVFTGGEVVLLDRMETSITNLAIPDKPSNGNGTPVTDIINMPITGQVDSVRVYLDITHAWMSDLIVKLTSPDGTQLRVLFIGEGGENDGRMMGWYPDDFTPKDDLNGFDGENAGGNWTITAQDYSNEAAGVLNEWRLQVFYTQ